MRPIRVAYALILGSLVSVANLRAQSVDPYAAVPRVITLSGMFRPADGNAPAPIETVRLALYGDEVGGSPLWEETQTIPIARDGQYSIVLGQTQPDGIPPQVFASGDARWLGMTWARPAEMEGSRTRITSVPYALRASDADTLGGRPASAYLLAPTATEAGSKATTSSSATTQSMTSATPSSVLGGTPNFLAKYVDSVDVGNSAVYEAGGAVGIGTSTPLDSLHVRFTNTNGGLTGFAVQNLGSTATSYSGMLFYDQNGALGQFQGFNNSTHEYRINNIASGGTINFMIGGTSRLQIGNNGDITFGGSANTAQLRLPNNEATGLGLGVLGGGAICGGLPCTNVGNGNTALGSFAISTPGNGGQNTAVGAEALFSTSSGQNNTAIGFLAGHNLGTGSDNIAIGFEAGRLLTSSSSRNIAIGNSGTSIDNGVIRIGTAGTQTTFFAAGIRGIPTTNNDAIPVVIDSAGQLGTISSSRRFKQDIQDMGEASRRLMDLRPVTFRYQQPFVDGSKPIQYGLIAEEVEEIFPDLVARSADGQIESVKYQLLDVLLLNELQRQQDEIKRDHEELQALRERLQALETALITRR